MSPFEKITSRQSISNTMLPPFLQVKNSGVTDLLKAIPIGKVKTADTSTNELNKQDRAEKMTHFTETIAGKTNVSPDFLNFIFDSKLQQDQPLIRVGKIELTRKDLSCLRPGKLLPINLIDACLSCYKKKNKKLLQKSNTHPRVIIVKTNFAKKVFQSKEKISIRSKKNMLNFDYLLFPLDISYWTLLVVNCREKSAVYYDPMGIENNDKTIFNCLYDFLKQELNFHQNFQIEKTRWRHLDYKRVNEVEPFDHIDTEIYILRMALKVCTGRDLEINPKKMNDYRKDQIAILLKYGTKVVY
jgi:Ulp1 family protease